MTFLEMVDMSDNLVTVSFEINIRFTDSGRSFKDAFATAIKFENR